MARLRSLALTRSQTLVFAMVAGAPALVHAGFTPIVPGSLDGVNSYGATLVDLDGDGHVDFVGHQQQIHWGLGDGTFELGATCSGQGTPIVADYDGDGDLDIVRLRDDPQMCWNNGDRTFTTVDEDIEPTGFTFEGRGWGNVAYSAAAGDLDGDGDVEIYVANFESNQGTDTIPDFYFYPDVLYDNDGSGVLRVARTLDADEYSWPSRNVTLTDFDNDNDPDIYVSHYRLCENSLWRNDGGGTYVDVTRERRARGPGISGATASARRPDGTSFTYPVYGHTISSFSGDVDADGDLDLMLGNFAHFGQPTVALLRNDLDLGVFAVEANHIAWRESYAGVSPADFDNDGDLDFFITTVYAADTGQLYENLGDGTSNVVTASEGLLALDDVGGTTGQHEGYAAIWADLNEDGALDLYLSGRQTYRVLLSEPRSEHWLRVRPRGDGSAVNRDGLGARVVVHLDDGRRMTREIASGGTGGDRGTNELVAHFGLGDVATPRTVDLWWPYRERCRYRDVPVDGTWAPVYDAAACEPVPVEPDPSDTTGGDTTDGGEDDTTDGGSASSSSGVGVDSGATSPGDTGSAGSGESDGATREPTTDDSSSSSGGSPEISSKGCGCRGTGGFPWALVGPWGLLSFRRAAARDEPSRTRPGVGASAALLGLSRIGDRSMRRIWPTRSRSENVDPSIGTTCWPTKSGMRSSRPSRSSGCRARSGCRAM